ncbi:MAG: DUF6785 family protein [Desulfovibrio sp.]|uniref:DUF6785 family protein n=1 Tax=Desulfovibrio sp. 7SRBS1 TaxID=3378064 RepID=UPI003B3CAD12
MRTRIRLRAIALGVIGGLLICAATPFNNLYLRATLLGGGHFPLAPFFVITWLAILIAIIARISKRPAFLSGLELLVSWILMVLVSGIPYTGLVRTFFTNLTAPVYFDTPGNRWASLIKPYLPSGLFPTSTAAVQQLYDGIPGGVSMSTSELAGHIPWHAWVTPFIWWGAFIFLCYFCMLCLVNIFSRQWVENERVNFPLLALPMAMEESLDENKLGAFLTNRYLLIGMLIPVILHTINGLNAFFPQVPQFPTLFLAGKYFAKFGLFSGFHKLKVYIYPAFIGFAFVTSRQISFSLWFFYITGCLLAGLLEITGLNIPPSALGVTFGPTLSSVPETQMIGAYLVFFLFIVWLARQHLVRVFKSALFLSKPEEAAWFSVRISFWGFILGFGLLVLWCSHFGMSMLTAVLVMVAFFLFSLVASRIICQGGIAYFTLTTAPLDSLMAFFGSKVFSPAGLLLSAVAQKVLFVDFRESLMPSLVHGAKVGEKIKNRRLYLTGIVAVVLLGVVVSFAAMLMLCYRYGLRELDLDWATRTTLTVYENVGRITENASSPSHWVGTFSIIGGLIMLALVFCYHRFYWWPIHPIGYLATYSSAMRILWFSFFIGWLVNQLSLRYGGITLFKKVRFFFFGLILGDFLMGGLWALIGLETGISYMVLPD